jgi:hypothetical protein
VTAADRLAKCVRLLNQLDSPPALYRDRNRDGYIYMVLAYRFDKNGKSIQRKLYLGNPSSVAIEYLKALIKNAWPPAPALDINQKRISVLQDYNHRVLKLLRRVAKNAGFKFHGQEMRKESR